MKRLGNEWWLGPVLAAAVVIACGGGGGGANTGVDGAPSPAVLLYAGSLERAGSNDGVGIAAQFNLPAGVAQDASGTIYVADTGNHTIRKIAGDGTVSTMAGAAGQPGSTDGTGGAARFSSPRAVAVDSQGNLYVADTGNAVVRKISAGGVVTTLAGAAGQTGGADGSGANAQFVSPVALALDATGNLFVADAAGAVRKIAPGGIVSTFVGATGQHGFVVGNGTAARFMVVSGVAVDAAGNVAVSEYTASSSGVDTGKVRRFDNQTQPLPWGNTVDGVVQVAPPSSIAADSAGNIYVTSKGYLLLAIAHPIVYDSVKMITPQGAVVPIAGQDTKEIITGLGLLDGPGAMARFYYPGGIAVGTAGRLVVADTQNHAIRLIDSQGVVSTLAGGAGGGLVDGPRETARFYDPSGLVVHPDGTLDIQDTFNGLVRRISPAGTVSTLSFTRNGTLVTRFNFPERHIDIALDESDVLYIAEQSSVSRLLYAAQPSGQMRLLDTQSGSALSAGPMDRLYMASLSNVSYINTGGEGDSISTMHHTVASGFDSVSATLIAPNGVLYVADFNHTVSAVDAEGHVTLLAGQPGVAGHADGNSSQARLNRPVALALDPAGNLYVADIDTIRQITPDGQVRTVAGTPGQIWATPGPLPGSIGTVKGLAWYGGMLYATVQNAVLQIGPIR